MQLLTETHPYISKEMGEREDILNERAWDW